MRITILAALLAAISLLGGVVVGCEEQLLDEEQREEYEEALEDDPEREPEPDELGPDQRVGQEGLVGGAQPEEAEEAEE